MNSRTDFANTHDTGRRLSTETAIRQNHHLRRAATRATAKTPPKAPTLPRAVAAVVVEHARLAGLAFGRTVFAAAWDDATVGPFFGSMEPTGLELGRFKSAAVRAADRQLVGVRVGPDGETAAFPIDAAEGPAADPSARGSIRATVDRAFCRQKVRPLALRAALPTRPVRVDARRRHAFRLPAPMHGPALGVAGPSA